MNNTDRHRTVTWWVCEYQNCDYERALDESKAAYEVLEHLSEKHSLGSLEKRSVGTEDGR